MIIRLRLRATLRPLGRRSHTSIFSRRTAPVIPFCVRYRTLRLKVSLLRIEAKVLYRGKVTAKQVQTPIIEGIKRPSRNLSPIPKRLYAYTQKTFRLYAK